jgi:hypothetical protein
MAILKSLIYVIDIHTNTPLTVGRVRSSREGQGFKE